MKNKILNNIFLKKLFSFWFGPKKLTKEQEILVKKKYAEFFLENRILFKETVKSEKIPTVHRSELGEVTEIHPFIDYVKITHK